MNVFLSHPKLDVLYNPLLDEITHDALPKESLTERLCGLLRQSGVDSIVKQSWSHQEGLRTNPM